MAIGVQSYTGMLTGFFSLGRGRGGECCHVDDNHFIREKYQDTEI